MMKKMIYLLLLSSLLVVYATGCSNKAESESATVPVVKITTSSSENRFKAPEQSQQELYQDVFVTLLAPYIQKAIDDYYGQLLTTSPIYTPEYVEILNVERPMGYRTFSYIIKLQVKPYVGPHFVVGIDQLTISVGSGAVKVEKYEHLKSYDLPPNLQDMIKKVN